MPRKRPPAEAPASPSPVPAVLPAAAEKPVATAPAPAPSSPIAAAARELAPATVVRNYSIQFTGRSAAVLLGAAALVWVVAGFSEVLFILFLAMLLAVGIDSTVDKLERRRVPRALGILIIYLGILAVLVLVIALLVPVLVEESTQLADALPRIAEQVVALPRTYSIAIPGLENVSLAEVGQRIGEEVGAVASGVPKFLVGVGKAVTGVLVSSLLVLVVGFFLSADARFAPRLISRCFPPAMRPTVTEIAREIAGRLGHWVRAQILVGVFFGTCFGIGLAVMGVPFALSLGVAGAVLELIPYVGGAVVTVIAMLVALSISPLMAVGVLVLEVVVANVESHVVYPKLVGSAVGLHPLVIILALFIGAEAKGIIGALLAVPVAVVLQVLFDRFYRFPGDPVGTLDPAGEPSPPPAVAE